MEFIATGGTLSFIRSMGFGATALEEISTYPSILGGRVKSLHPAIFGGILARPSLPADRKEMQQYGLHAIDMVVVDLYPFEECLASGAAHDELVEQIDVGGVALIRAAAKNHASVLVLPHRDTYHEGLHLLGKQSGASSLEDRRRMAAVAMDVTSHYDGIIYRYLNGDSRRVFKESIRESFPLRYGENPHQEGRYYGQMDKLVEQLSGKDLSYNNLLDVDAAMGFIREFDQPVFAIVKHGNICGAATAESIQDAWPLAFSGDPLSAFGGVFIANREVDEGLAADMDSVFFEALVAPSYTDASLEILSRKKNRILLKDKRGSGSAGSYRSLSHGVLWQSSDEGSFSPDGWKIPTRARPTSEQLSDMVFANKVVKHLKSNAIAIVKDQKLLGMGAGQTSRIDALDHAIRKARENKRDLSDSVMASDAFFPFPDCVSLAQKYGITSVIQPGGSIRDQESIDFCDHAGMAMAMTGRRHFRH